jgi:hypothetical protein
MADLVSHQEIEEAYKQAKDVTAKLPESTESRRAQEHLGLAEKYVHEARDRAKVDRVTEPELDASVEMKIRYDAVVSALIKPEYLSAACPTHGSSCRANNAQVSGWPSASPAARWTWNDGSAP